MATFVRARADARAVAEYLEAISLIPCSRSRRGLPRNRRLAHRERSEEQRQAFILSAKRYGDRNGIEYRTWREVGVDRWTLRESGICPLTAQ
jgi:hypothetical protein